MRLVLLAALLASLCSTPVLAQTVGCIAQFETPRGAVVRAGVEIIDGRLSRGILEYEDTRSWANMHSRGGKLYFLLSAANERADWTQPGSVASEIAGVGIVGPENRSMPSTLDLTVAEERFTMDWNRRVSGSIDLAFVSELRVFVPNAVNVDAANIQQAVFRLTDARLPGSVFITLREPDGRRSSAMISLRDFRDQALTPAITTLREAYLARRCQGQ